MPLLGYGVFLVPPQEAERCVGDALSVGYRLIDTAQAYQNEEGVGTAIANSGIKREDIFLVTKVWIANAGEEKAARSIDDSLRSLKTDYIDLLLIHQAYGDVFGSWRAIGVSNFLEGDIESLWETAEIKPMVDQILCHISNSPIGLIDYCTKKGIVTEAYSPVAHGEAMKNPLIAEMAEKYGVSVPQLCIRFDIQLGMIVLPKSADPEHMKANADVDFVIGDEDMKALTAIDHISDYGEHSFFPVFGGKI